ncbi:ABC transporter substrate-binding protein [Streptacidiphilus carbonis]|uniref:ABC transporter substrate-binding protein n=1 Tax=Streptacidiphilus carbonis TaxID=105422 RepID=UPI0005AB8226|nr:extracellular solute-binding protein [Streptacidiphilus carbonis]
MSELSRRSMLFGVGAVALGLAGCSTGGGTKKASDLSGNSADSMTAYAVGDRFKAGKPLTFTTLYDDNTNYPYNKDWLFWSEVSKRTGVTLNPTIVPYSDYETKRSVIIGAGSAPSIIPKTYPGQEVPFIASGAILPVSDYTDLMPNFKDKVAKWNLEGDLDALRQDDGKYYVLPGLHQDVWPDYSLAVRTDVLQKLGLQTPTTWDELHTVLKAMKAAHPDSYPMSDRWSIPTPGGNLLNLLGQSYGTAGGWGYNNATWDPNAGQFVLTAGMDQYKQMLQYVNTLVQEKLLDPESFTQTDDQAKAKFTSGKSFVISTNAQELVNTYRPALATTIPGATVVKIPVPMGPAGATKMGSRLENGLMITKNARNSPDFVAMMQFIDWLWYSDEGEVLAKWGVEGVTYTVDPAGDYRFTPDVNYVGLNPKGTKNLQKDFGFMNGNFAYGGATKLLDSMFSAEELVFQKAMGARKTLAVPPPYPLTEDERQQSTLWDTPLKDYVTQQTLKFVLGDRPLSQWDAFVGEVKSKGGTSYLNLVNKAYQRYKGKKG